MKLIYISNYINHHVRPLCDFLYGELGEGFSFLQTDKMTDERKAMGWGDDCAGLPYVKNFETDEEKLKAEKLIMESDIAIFGWSSLPFELMQKRFLSGKPSFRVSERIYKEGQWKRFSPRGLAAKKKEHIAFKDHPVYLLCAGAYVASDFELIGAYPDKMYRWGYFTKTGDDTLTQWEDKECLKICWAGRFMKLKHPEYAVKAAELLKHEGISFELHMVGDGELRSHLKDEAKKANIINEVTFHGMLAPGEVRMLMKKSHIFLFTSNYLEGWGAVVNEAMDSGCAVLASEEAGCVPYLIKDGVNGLSYKNNDYNLFKEKLLMLAKDSVLAGKFGRAGIKTIRNKWSPEEAGKRLLSFCEALLSDKKPPDIEDDGPLSKAPVIKAQSFFRTLQEENIQDGG